MDNYYNALVSNIQFSNLNFLKQSLKINIAKVFLYSIVFFFIQFSYAQNYFLTSLEVEENNVITIPTDGWNAENVSVRDTDTLTWYLDNVTFTNGATASGYFDYNAITNTYSNFNITIHNSPTTGNTSYGVHHPSFSGLPNIMATLESANGDLTGVKVLQFVYENNLTESGGTVSIKDAESSSSSQGICEDANCNTFEQEDAVASGGRVTTNPTAPIITTVAQVSVDENQTFVINVDATDANGDSEGAGLTFSLSENGIDDLLFNIDTNTGEITFINVPDFENPVDSDEDNIYDIEVTVTDSGGLINVQNLQIAIIAALSVEEQLLLTVKMYPNPTTDKFFVEGLQEVSQVMIYDLNGRLILIEQDYQEQEGIVIENLNAGTYLVKINGEKTNSIQKLIKH